jgi:hypothetical protein
MIIEILSILAMNTEFERVFSGARCTISWERMQLRGENIEKPECLKNWVRSGLTMGVEVEKLGAN